MKIHEGEEGKSLRKKFGKLFKIFEESLNHSFEESMKIYYKKIVELLR